jgi:septum formation protein
VEIILASSSPRRKALLGLLGVDFDCVNPSVDESPLAFESARKLVQRLALSKAQAVVSKTKGSLADTIVIAGDLVIEFDDQVIGKPKDRSDALATLLSLSGCRHYIQDGFAIFLGDEVISSGVSTSIVEFKKFDEKTANSYLDLIDWKDKAGSYAIQDGKGSHKMIIKETTGSLYSIIGLPLKEIAVILVSLGVEMSPQRLNEIIFEENNILDLYSRLEKSK